MLYNLLTTNNPNLMYAKWLLILTIIMICLLLYKNLKPVEMKEGFYQEKPYVLKLNENTLDLFYIELYVILHNVKNRVDKELVHILKATNPCKENSVFLDVGSGVGETVYQLKNEGFNAFGIDKSKNMCDFAKRTYNDIEVLNDDILKPMAFEKNTFTHILCTYFTIYQIEDKKRFFSNCFFWMKSGGYLVVHLVHKKKFDRVIPNTDAISKRTVMPHGADKLSTRAIFDDYEYNGSFEILDDKARFIETFTDLETKHIRENHTDLYMENIYDICGYAKSCGFIFHGKTNMFNINNDKHQYLYYFERPL